MRASLAKRFNMMGVVVKCFRSWSVGVVLACLLAGCGQKESQPNGLLSGPEHLAAAKTAQQLGDYPEALLQIRRALRLEPNNVDYRWLHSSLLLESGDPAAAELRLERMVQLGMTHPDLAIRVARLQLLLNKPNDVLERPLPQINDENIGTVAALHYLRGKTFSARDWSTEARVEYIKAIDLYEQARLMAKISPEALTLRREMWVLQSTEEDLQAAYSHANCGNGDERIEPPPVFTLPAATGRELRVGPGESFKQPADAAKVAEDGDVIRIAAGRYSQPAIWRANQLQIIGERDASGLPLVEISGGGGIAEDTAIWLLKGDKTIVEGVRFTGASNSRGTAAGLRLEGAGLVVRHSQFLSNQIGLMTVGQPVGAINAATNLVDIDPDIGSHVLVEFSEFGYNGTSTNGMVTENDAHNVNIGREDRLTFRYNYSHHALGGHLLHSEARINNIRSNRLSDEQEGITRYLINLPQGGVSYVVGNVLFQSFRPGDQTMINFGVNEARDSPNRLRVFNNSAMNQSVKGVFIDNAIAVPAIVANNLFFGTSGTLIRGPVERRFNELTAVAGVVDAKELDFRLRPESTLVDGGIAVQERDGIRMYADAEYRHPMKADPRLKVWKPDIGAYEYCRNH